MAIGSAPEVGAEFSSAKDFTSEDAVWEWYKIWREFVGDDLLGGYATLAYPSGYGPDDKQQTGKVD
jgi:hypothetical protein